MQEQGELPNPFQRDIINLRRCRSGQILNNAGRYTYKLDDERRLQRFLVQGLVNNTYRTQDSNLTRDRLQSLDKLIKDKKGIQAVKLIEKISVERRNLRHKPLMFALALCARCNDKATKSAAYMVLPRVCRTPTHLFYFVEFCEEFSAPGTGWGRAHKAAIKNWYLQFRDKPTQLLHLVMKYQRRGGWTHRDLLRLAHPKPPNSAMKYIFRCIIDSQHQLNPSLSEDDEPLDDLKERADVYYTARQCRNEEELVNLIQEFDLGWEHIATDMLNSGAIWRALLPKMPIEAFLRNLVRMTRLGVFAENSEEEEVAVDKINNMNAVVEEAMEEDDEDEELVTRRKNVIHPFRVFITLQMYRSGGQRGRGRVSCSPNPSIVRALENAFYKAFKYLQPTNKKCLIAVDVSAFMAQEVLGVRDIRCSEAAMVMIISFVRTEPNVIVGGFSTEFTDLNINSSNTLEEAMGQTDLCIGTGGPSDCTTPLKWAQENNINDIDAFILFTSNTNSHGFIHPAESVRLYRKYARNERVKLVVCGMCDNDFSIADQDDWDMIDVIGFDLALPYVIAEFIKDDD